MKDKITIRMKLALDKISDQKQKERKIISHLESLTYRGTIDRIDASPAVCAIMRADTMRYVGGYFNSAEVNELPEDGTIRMIIDEETEITITGL
jgi:SET domain-containing protein